MLRAPPRAGPPARSARPDTLMHHEEHRRVTGSLPAEHALGRVAGRGRRAARGRAVPNAPAEYAAITTTRRLPPPVQPFVAGVMSHMILSRPGGEAQVGNGDDIVNKARASASNLRFAEAQTLAECLGFELVKRKGKGNASHRRYKLPGYPGVINIQPGKNGKAKSYQVRQILRIHDNLPEGT